jgi:hypothetical protein
MSYRTLFAVWHYAMKLYTFYESLFATSDTLTTLQAGRSRARIPVGAKKSFFKALGPTHTPFEFVPGDFPRVVRLGHEVSLTSV